MDLVVFGAGDMARLADWYFTRDSDHDVIAFAVDRPYLDGDTFLDRPLVDFDHVEREYSPAEFGMFVALSYAGMNAARAGRCRAALEKGYELASYVSSRCTFLSDNPVGDNCFILEDNTIQPFARIGADVTLWSGNHIGHDVVVEDHCFISSHVVLSGHVRVGEASFLGVNSSVTPGVSVGRGTLVGAGAVITSDTAPGSVHAPARSTVLGMASRDVELR